MHNELTKVDIEKMKAELAEREAKLPAQHEEVKRTREYGDLSENDEYRCAKRELNSNRSRIRYLQNMINTAVVISTESADGVVGLFDWVEIYLPEDDETRTVRIVTTMRVNASLDAVSIPLRQGAAWPQGRRDRHRPRGRNVFLSGSYRLRQKRRG